MATNQPAAHPAEAQPRGAEYLLFTCRQIPCAVALHELREVMRAVPHSVPLPFSPPWLLGVFSLRTELLGLVDPAPMLLGAGWAARDPAPPTATLIVGSPEPLLGLAVGAVGEITRIQPEQIEPLHLPADSTGIPAYVSGRYHPAGAPHPYAVVDMAPFVAALLRALEESSSHA